VAVEPALLRSAAEERDDCAQPGGMGPPAPRLSRMRPLISAEDNLIPPRKRIGRPHRLRSIFFHERRVIRTGDGNVRVRKVFRTNVKLR
jgi:hypothetical protein